VTVRTAQEALAQRPLRFLASSWPWRSLAYLLSGVLVGAVTLAVLSVLVSTGLILALGLVGLLLFVPIALSGMVVARFERWRLRLVDIEPALDPHRPPQRPGHRAWLVTRLREQATWRELGYAVVSALALWWIDLAVIFLALYLPVVGMAAPFYLPDLLTALAAVVVGVLLLPISAYPITAWAGARAALTRAVLAPRDAELGERLVEVSASRARLVDAFEVERRRIERDLHDGAQQRLVALTMTLGLARLDLPPESAAADQVGAAHEQAKAALAELRELIRGIHPKVLADRGLPAAVGDVAGRSPVPVEVDIVLPSRLPPPVELTAYFVVCEGLANIAKHSAASRARVRGRLVEDLLVVEVHDDGVGGAEPSAGSGLAGLADRVAVVDGRLFLSSPVGGATQLRVEIPCAQIGSSG